MRDLESLCSALLRSQRRVVSSSSGHSLELTHQVNSVRDTMRFPPPHSCCCWECTCACPFPQKPSSQTNTPPAALGGESSSSGNCIIHPVTLGAIGSSLCLLFFLFQSRLIRSRKEVSQKEIVDPSLLSPNPSFDLERFPVPQRFSTCLLVVFFFAGSHPNRLPGSVDRHSPGPDSPPPPPILGGPPSVRFVASQHPDPSMTWRMEG